MSFMASRPSREDPLAQSEAEVGLELETARAQVHELEVEPALHGGRPRVAPEGPADVAHPAPQTVDDRRRDQPEGYRKLRGRRARGVRGRIRVREDLEADPRGQRLIDQQVD